VNPKVDTGLQENMEQRLQHAMKQITMREGVPLTETDLIKKQLEKNKLKKMINSA
jgi:hypothetical protein